MGLLAGFCLLGSSRAAWFRKPSADIYIAPNGNDTWSGALPKPKDGDGPVATIARAQELVRARRLSQAGPITVLLRGGTYRISEPLTFGPADSGSRAAPITWAAYPGEKPIVSGGRVLQGWTETEDGLWALNVPEVASGEWFFWQLFVDGQRRRRCREPDEGYFRSEGPFIPRPARRSKEWGNPECRIGFFFKDGDLQAWKDMDNGTGVVSQSWTASVHWIDTIDEAKHELRFTKGSGWPMGYWEKNQRYYIENVRAALDEPGEWYLNRHTGLCLYKPRKGERIESFAPIAPVADQLLRVEGDSDAGLPAEGLVFQGLSFQHGAFVLPYDQRHDGQAAISLTGAIYTKGTVNCRFEDIEVAHVGTYAVWFAAGTRDTTLIRSELHDLGAGGVKIGETRSEQTEATACRNNLVDNCFIHDGGHIAKAGIGVWIGRSNYHTVSRNEICDFDYSGGSIGWSWGYAPSSANHNVFEYNHIHHIGNGVLSDMGGIYCLGKSPGTVLRGNVMHDIASYSYGGWGLYTDEGSSDIVMEKNVVYNTKSGGFHQHYGRDNIVRHNILAFAREGQIIRSREEKHLSFTVEKNIVIFDNGLPLGKNYNNGNYAFDNNLYWDVTGEPFLFAGYDLEEWREEGNDANSLVADPKFRNARKFDFRLSPGSPAHLLGIEPLQNFSKVGLYGPSWWTRKPKGAVHRPLDASMKPAKGGKTSRRNPKLIAEDCEGVDVGAKISFAGTSGEEKGASIRVVPNPAGEGKCLKFQDADDLEREWQPHLSGSLMWRKGAVRASLDVLMTSGGHFWHEWRDRASPYGVGPNLRFKDGKLNTGSTELCSYPMDTWMHVEIRCPIGDDAKGVFELALTVAGKEPRTFKDVPFGKAGWQRLESIVWVSNATVTSEFYLDNLRYERVPLAELGE